jgi:excisionase family DNA binding protein
MTVTIPRLLTQTEVCERLGVSRVALWSWRSAGQFPAPIVLGRRLRWPEHEVAAFLEQRRASK